VTTAITIRGAIKKFCNSLWQNLYLINF